MKYLPIILFMLILLVGGCHQGKVTDDVFRWPVSGIPEADSVLLEYEHLVYSDLRKSARNKTADELISEYCSIANVHKDNELLQIRARYLSAIDLLHHGRQEFREYVTNSLALTDSSNYPYDYHKILALMATENDDPVTKYFVAIDNVDFFRKYDSPFEIARNLIIAGNVMSNLRDTVLALKYYKASAEISEELNFPHGIRIAYNNIAILSSEETHDSICNKFLADSSGRNDPYSRVLLLHNMFTSKDDSLPLLEEALEIYNKEPVDMSNKPLLIGLIGRYYTQQGNPGKAFEFLQMAMDSTKKYSPNNAKHLYILWNYMADLYYYTGQKDSCIEALSRARVYQSQYEQECAHAGVYATESAFRIKIAQQTARHEKEKLIAIFIIVLLLIAFGIVWLIFQYKKKRVEKQYREMLMAEKMERYSQSISAQAKVMEEGDRLLSIIEGRIDELKATSKISSEGADNLISVLKLHRSNEDNRQGFLMVQKELDVRFGERLRTDYPELSEGQVKLASMIAAGLDIRQIGSILNIEPKSVHKSRYRLRSRLNLTKEQSLEDFLRTYNRQI